MSAVALAGDCATTTALALAAAWPNDAPSTDRDVLVVEVDPEGGSLAAWLDVPLAPSLSSVVTELHHATSANGAVPSNGTGRSTWNSIDAMIRRSPAGIRFIPAPFRAIEARRAVAESERHLLALLAATPDFFTLFDVGRIDPTRPPVATQHADLTVLCHRLDASSAPAATVRLERLAESVEALRGAGRDVAIALIGDDPFPLDEVLDFAAPGAPGWQLAVDPLAAAVLAGRAGVSARRLMRLPLIRSATAIASDLASMLTSPHDARSTHGERDAIDRLSSTHASATAGGEPR